jgi:ABC-2 type transport system ATP-binding protein
MDELPQAVCLSQRAKAQAAIAWSLPFWGRAMRMPRARAWRSDRTSSRHINTETELFCIAAKWWLGLARLLRRTASKATMATRFSDAATRRAARFRTFHYIAGAATICAAPSNPITVSAILESMQPIVSVTNLSKTYASGFHALKNINLAIDRGEIFALLGPNGAGKTTLISIICGIVNASAGSVTVDGRDIATDYRGARSLIGLVPQELTTDSFESVWATVSFSRGLFGKPKNPAYIEKVLRDLSLWEKRDSKIITLSGGMKRRVLIAKALSHEPRVLFLDEPTAGVDVELRRDMWKLVRSLAESGVTIILTTHYIDEAEEMADRIGVINAGEIMLVEEKTELMRKLGKKQLTLQLESPLGHVPASLAGYALAVAKDGNELIYTYEGEGGRTDIIALLKALDDAGIRFKDLHTTQSSLEDIFVSLLRGDQ